MHSISENNMESTVTDVEEGRWRGRESASITIHRNLFTEICQSSSIFIFLIILAIIPISQVIIGWRYSTACPINQLISHYLIVAGAVCLLLVVLISLTQIMSRTFARRMFDDTDDKANPNRSTMIVGCGVCSIMCINFSLFIFLIGWSVVGWVWVIEVWHRVQYHSAHRDDYCHPVLYQFTFTLLLLTTTLKLIFFCFVCRKSCSRVISDERKDSARSEA